MADQVSFGTAIALLEYASIAAGIEAGDAMAKRAALSVIHAGTVHPGKYLVMVGGGVADIEEALDAAHRLESSSLIDEMFLPDPHVQLVAALAGQRSRGDGEALGVIETTSVSSVILAADAGLKGAGVVLRDIYLADGLGGKGYLLFSGPLVEIQVAVELGSERASADLVGQRVIAQLHDEMNVNLVGDGQFSSRVRGA
ncbi:MAG: BMC domain-containing protein [Acidimicrobiia bacterium]|nr:BMC domain-containing protein [Acidimicrobiia bacterium]